MALIGQGGKITSFPNNSEKLCVACEHCRKQGCYLLQSLVHVFF